MKVNDANNKEKTRRKKREKGKSNELSNVIQRMHIFPQKKPNAGKRIAVL